jgi:hypothetical protein
MPRTRCPSLLLGKWPTLHVAVCAAFLCGGGGGQQPLAGQHHPTALSPALCLLQVLCGPAHLSFHGSLLQLRGAAPSSSPLRDAAGNLLLFNGQVFGGGLAVPPGANDAQLLLGALAAAGAAGVPAVLTGLQGPWALTYWQHATRTLWFGRDPIGGFGRDGCLAGTGGVGAVAARTPAGLLAAAFPVFVRTPRPPLRPPPHSHTPLPQGAAACCCTCPARQTGGSS